MQNADVPKTRSFKTITRYIALLAVSASLCAPSTLAQESEPAPPPVPDGKVLVEIYRIAPGKHRAFLEEIAKYDAVNAKAGLPPRQLYVHSDGAGWDFMLIQPAKTPADKVDALVAAWEEADMPSGADFFLNFRQYIADHSDTFARGPTSAASFLAEADAD
ncbi:MAG: hypothetical protein CMK07_16590 [Ponticaulis sp.]|nr:hypothetical protein [Ponticaulis sp.]